MLPLSYACTRRREAAVGSLSGVKHGAGRWPIAEDGLGSVPKVFERKYKGPAHVRYWHMPFHSTVPVPEPVFGYMAGTVRIFTLLTGTDFSFLFLFHM